MRNRVEVLRQVGVNDIGVAPADQPVHFPDRVGRTATGPVAIGSIVEIRLEDRFQHELGGGLNHPIPYSRDAQRTFAAPWLRDHHPSHRRGPIRLQGEFLTQARQPCVQALRLDLCERHPVHPGRTRIGAGKPVGVAEDVLAVDLVVEQVEAERRLRLRLTIKLPLKGPDLIGCFEAHRQSPPPLRLRKRTRSQGPSLRRSYPGSAVLCPCPTPPRSTAVSDVEAATSDRMGLPRYPHHLSGVPCPLPRRIETGALVDCFPAHAAFPVLQAGRHPHLYFRRPAQASLTLRPVGLLNRPRRPLSRGFDPAGHPTKPLASYQSNRQLSGWNLPPLVKRAIGAHCIIQEICN